MTDQSANFVVEPNQKLFLPRIMIATILAILLVVSSIDISEAGSRKRTAIAAGVAGVIIGIAIAEKNKKKKQKATSKKKAPTKKKVAKKKSSSKKKRKIAKRKTTGKSRTQVAAISGNRETVAKVQAKLNEIGFDAGPVDGQAGNRTREAIRNYQTSIGASVTGSLTDDQRELLLDNSQQIQTADSGSEPKIIEASLTSEPVETIEIKIQTEDDIIKLQNALATLGFDIGSATGKLEGQTIIAIMGFQETLNDPQTGKLTEDQIAKLLGASRVAGTPDTGSRAIDDTSTSGVDARTVLAENNDSELDEPIPDLSNLDTLD